MIAKFRNAEIYTHVRRLFSFLKESGVHFGYLALSVILSLCYTLFTMYSVSLLIPLSTGIIKGDFGNVRDMSIVGSIVKGHPDLFTTSTKLFILLVAWVYATIIFKNVLYYYTFLTTQYQSRIATIKLREMLLKKCLSYEKSFYDKNSISFLQRLLSKSTTIVENQFTTLQELFIQVSLLLVYAILMFRISWRLTLVSLIVFPLVNFTTKGVVKRIKGAASLYNTLAAKLDEKIFNILYCVPVIKGFAQEKKEMDLFAEASKEEINQSFKLQKLNNLIAPIEDIGTTSGILLIAISMAIFMKFDHSLTAASVLVFFYLAIKIIPSFNAVNNFHTKMASAVEPMQEIEYVLNHSDHFRLDGGAALFDGLRREIEIRNLTFTFPDNKEPTLAGVTCTFEAGKTTAIVGPSGSGKTTLTNILLRFYDCPEGTIFLDGKDLRDFSTQSVRSHMAFVGQDSLLFNDTLTHNIEYARHGSMADEKIREISLNTRVDDITSRLAEGFDTKVGERGSKLSGGEKQRVSIARALIKDPEILFFDEATSALDSRTEERISEYLYEAYKGKTKIIIAHRLSTIKRADKIIYLEKGSVIETGTFDELLALNGHFFKQWEAQRI